MANLTLGARTLKGVPVGNLLMSAYGPNGTPANNILTNLATFQLPANPIRVGEGLRLTAWARTAANTNTKRLRVFLGATGLIDTTALEANNEHWYFEMLLLRTGAAAQTVVWSGLRGSTVLPAVVAATTEDMATSLLFRIAGQNGGATLNDLALHGALLQVVR